MSGPGTRRSRRRPPDGSMSFVQALQWLVDNHLAVIRQTSLPREGRAGLEVGTLFAIFEAECRSLLTPSHKVQVGTRQGFGKQLHNYLDNATEYEAIFDPSSRYVDYARDRGGLKRLSSGKVHSRRGIAPPSHHAHRAASPARTTQHARRLVFTAGNSSKTGPGVVSIKRRDERSMKERPPEVR